MAKKRITLLFLIVSFFPLSSVRVIADNPRDIDLTIGYTDPGNGDENHRSAVLVPHVGIDNYTLTFYTPCDGYTLRLLDENDNIAFVTVIPDGTTSLVLPSYLSGEYTIKFITGQLCFYGLITF